MKRPTLTVVLSALIVALLVWFFWPAAPTVPPAPSALPASPVPAPAQSKSENPNSKITASAGERSTLADTLNTPSSNIRADLRVVSDILATFRTNFPREGNPVGTNAEITAVLTGQNRLRLALIPPDHPAINQEGELCDRWGTPFFFHAESGTRMTIESAGPDKKRHTPDDEVFAP
ncbi:MAG: hypothetical protein NTV51_26635 [Verrucomicrobia bacterium]|nr:hypothetical protein [Verrucomicrobiota bacterium]